MWHEPSAYAWKHDRRDSVELYRQWAEGAWLEAGRECPEMLGDSNYALGFRDGFVDYVYAGGNGEPPPVPPRHYWKAMLRSPEGKQQADQWFAGYRHGAQSARNGGFRELGTIRTSLVAGVEPVDPSLYSPEFVNPFSTDPDETASQGELIPEPRATPSSPALPAPERPSAGVPSAAGGSIEPNASLPLPDPDIDTRPSDDEPGNEGDPTALPDDLTLPMDEPPGNPFESDGARLDARPMRPPVEPSAISPGSVAHAEPQRIAIGGMSASNSAPPGSTIRMLAAPMNPAEGHEPKIVVHLAPTPIAADGAVVAKSPVPRVAASVQLTSGSETADPPAESATSTIRIRFEPDQGQPASLPFVPKRKATFLR